MTDLMEKTEVIEVPLKDCNDTFQKVYPNQGVVSQNIKKGFLCSKSLNMSSKACEGELFPNIYNKFCIISDFFS